MRFIATMVGWLGLTLPVLAAEPIRVLFLGDRGHHKPAERAEQLIPALGQVGIFVDYSEDVKDLNPKTLARYDGLIVYANITKIEPAQEQALLDYVEGGKGFIPLHCASYCFLNSEKYVQLVGAQFKSHGTGVFRDKITQADHPINRGFAGFESWDETYVHSRHNDVDRTILAYRDDEPWTWIRTQGKGRVFYTAWGHDQRTWSHPGFLNLVERGIRWAVGQDPGRVPAYQQTNPNPAVRFRPEMTSKRTDVAPFEYQPAKIAFYPPGGPRKGDGEWNQMQKPLPPTESHKHLVTPVGFKAELFAADPDITKPICMNWDHRGRLWIVESIDYPNDRPEPGKGRDRIKVCEDTDGDGRADKFTVFADQLNIPTGILLVDQGCIIHHAPDTIYFADTDGDGKADHREILFTGWGTFDTHAGPSNLIYGHDNWIWGSVGYSGFKGVVGNENLEFKQGYYRFKKDGSKLEFLRSTNNNTWGLGLSEEGLVFGSTANNNPSVHLPIPNRYYEKIRGGSAEVLKMIADSSQFSAVTDKVRQVDVHGGYTAGAGHALYTARTYPQEYWNRTAFVAEPTGHLVGTFLLNQHGTSFSSVNPFNLLASDDEWCAPIMAEVGPDGNVWVIDWYNYIVQHNPTPVGFQNGKGNAYETDLRDKHHGRIYRVVYQGVKPEPLPTLDPKDPASLLAGLKHSNLFWRRQAQRLLVERANKDAVPALTKLIEDQTVDAVGINGGAIHALWTLQGLGAAGDVKETLLTALKHPSPAVRMNALQVIGTLSGLTMTQGRFPDDPDPLVRQAHLLYLADAPAVEAGVLLAAVVQQAYTMLDRNLADAFTAAAAAHDQGFLTALCQQPVGRLVGSAEQAIKTVAAHYAKGRPADQLSLLVTSLAATDPKIADLIVSGLSAGWPKDHRTTLSDAAEQSLGKLLERLPNSSRAQLLRVATVGWGSKSLSQHTAKVTEQLRQTLNDAKAGESDRVAAARQLVDLNNDDPQLTASLFDLVSGPKTAPTLAAGLVEALSAAEVEATAKAALTQYSQCPPAARQAILRLLLSKPTATERMLIAVEGGNFALSELSLDQKQALANHPDRKLANRAKKLLESGGGLPSPDRVKVLQSLTAVTTKVGDAKAGKAVFTKQCSKCHTHAGEGAKIGPDLTGMAVHPKAELLVHLIDPSRSVEGNYRVYQVLMDDGRVLNGLLSAESKTSIELIDAEAKKHVLTRDEIEKLSMSTKSLMPDGFEKQVTETELTDLLEFLTTKGKYLPLDLRKAATVVSTKGMFHGSESPTERLIFPDWTPKTFQGVPFSLVDPQGDKVSNVIMLNGPLGSIPPKMPKNVTLACNTAAKAIHFLSGIGGWNAKQPVENGPVSMIVRLHYMGGKSEDHPLRDGHHFADYIGRFEVPGSQFAFAVRQQQVRYLAITPKESAVIERIEFIKGPDKSAPLVVAVTVETSH